MVYDIMLIYILFLLFDIPFLYSNSKMYNSLLLSINNNEILFTNEKYFSIFMIYVFLSLGLYYFVIKNSKNINDLIINAMIYGIILYGVYDFTNFSTINKYSKKIAIIDTLWGGILCTLVSISYVKLKSLTKIF